VAFQRGIRPLTMAEQELAMLQHRPAFTRTRRHPWVWRGILQVREQGQIYVIDMDAGDRSGARVQIWVREPTLVPYKNTGRPPHTFADGSLCVTERTAMANEFRADTTVPWIYSWFYFYERWLETGIWYGPQAEGHELGAAKPPEAAKPRRGTPDDRPPTRAPKRSRGEAA
jgi:hypothetical protein